MDTPTPKQSKRKRMADMMHDPINPDDSGDIQPGDIVRYNKGLHEVVRVECDPENNRLYVVLFGDKAKKRIPIEEVELITLPGARPKDYEGMELTKEQVENIEKAIEAIAEKMRALQEPPLLSASQEELKHHLQLLLQMRFGYEWHTPKFPNPLISTQSGYGLTAVLLSLRNAAGLDYICVTPQSWICIGASKPGTLEHLAERLKGNRPAIIQLKNLHTFNTSAQREDSAWMTSVKEEIKMLLSGKAPNCHNAFIVGSGYWDVDNGKVQFEDDTYEDSWSKTSKQDTSILKFFHTKPLILESPTEKDCNAIFQKLTKDESATCSFSSFYELGEKLLEYRMDKPIEFNKKMLDNI
jgi:hypothetical protein